MKYTKYSHLKVIYPNDAPKPSKEVLEAIIKGYLQITEIKPFTIMEVINYHGNTIELTYNYADKSYSLDCFSYT